MNCSTATELMLEADPRALGGEGDSELVSHIESCDRCRAIADRFLSGQLALANELDANVPRRTVEEALRAAEQRSIVLRRRKTLWQVGAPLAAAAGLVGLVLLGDGSTGSDVLLQTSVPEPLPGLEVSGPPGKDVAVFKVTDRPDIVVVWFFDTGD
jgi:hypothetical protein